MKKTLAALALLALSTAAVWADDKADLQSAVKQLADTPNYSWTSITDMQGGFGGGPQTTTGKTEKDGYSTLSVPAFALGGDAPPPLDVVMKGDKTVVKMPTGWKTAAELAAAANAGGDQAGGFNFGPEQQAIFALANLALPTTTAKEATDKLDNIKKTADGYAADLSADAVKSLLAFRGGAAGQPQPEVTAPKGSLKISTKDGTINKIVLQLAGSMDFGGGQPFDLARTVTIEIKDAGTTKVTVPDDAKKKLDAAPVPATMPAR